MGYECIVCIKQVPDTAHITGEAMKPDGTVNRAALAAIYNPEDLHALEAALRVRDRCGGRVTVLTMGPPTATEALRESLYRGVDRVIHLTDKRAAASDTLATSYILSCAIKTIGTYDLVFCGRQAIDGDTAQVGPQLAEKLHVPQITYFESFVELSGKSARVRRNVGNGWEVLESPLPLLLTVTDTENHPRPASARRMMKYKRARSADEVTKEVAVALDGKSDVDKEKEVGRRMEQLQMHQLLIEKWNLDDIHADLKWCGLAGSPTKVHRIQSIVLTKEGHTEIPPTEEGIQKMIQELIVDHTLG